MNAAIPLLSRKQHSFLIKLLSDRNTPLATRKRAAILLLLHAGQNRLGALPPLREVAEKATCSVWLVTSTRRRFTGGGMPAALSSPSQTGDSGTAARSLQPPQSTTPQFILDLQRRVRESDARSQESYELIQRIKSASQIFNKMTADSETFLRESF